MNNVFDRLEQGGRAGGSVALVAAVILVVVAVALAGLGTSWGTDFSALNTTELGDDIPWQDRGLLAGALLALALALPAGFFGAGLLTQRHYPDASEVFPPMATDAIRRALSTRTEDQCVCTRCRVMVPAAFSTGSCPVCASSVEYHEIRNDEDAALVVAALE